MKSEPPIPDISIVIPAFNEEIQLPETLACLQDLLPNLKPWRSEIIVADNNSTDRTPVIARDMGAVVVREPVQQIARARNAGARISRGRYLIFLDADTRVNVRLLTKTVDALATGKCCGGGAMIQFDREINLVIELVVFAWHLLSRSLKWAAGSYVFCLRQAFEDIGGFDEQYYAGEEVIFSRKLKKWGRRNGRSVVIIDEKVTTSARKLDWYSGANLVKVMLKLAIWPTSLKDKDACRFWYERPTT